MMDRASQYDIWTIGHSQHPVATFIRLLETHGIVHVADIRSFPTSRRYPQFNGPSLRAALQQQRIGYTHFPDLGGRQTHALVYSPNHAGVQRLTTLGRICRVAYMCAEADWRNCHRSGLSDYLLSSGWKVIHINGNGGTEEHPQIAAQGVLF